MWSPLRIDHHGWQLAMLALAIAALADKRPACGGLLLGAATAVSLTIGLELLVYLAVAGAAVALMWVRDPAQGRRLVTYGASLAGGCALGFLLFASYDNRQAVCDALSPVWLSAMVAAGAIAVVLPFLPLQSRVARLASAAGCGAVLAAGFALAWPHCLGRLEGSTPELEQLWLSNVREARPVYTHSWSIIAGVTPLPIIGLIGYIAMLWRLRRDEEPLTPWAAIAAMALLAAALLLWQSRAGPAAQLLAVPGATALAWLLIRWVSAIRMNLPRNAAIIAIFALVSGLGAQNLVGKILEPPNKRAKTVNRATGTCPTLAALRPIARQPKGYVLTFLDLNPRLIAVTHHNGIAGPYHRNQAAITELMKTWHGSPDNARLMVARRGIDYVLICPNFSETTLYSSRSPNGFYMQLAKGKAPEWLDPIQLPGSSPYKMWRVRR
jgi:hypothetical protein